MNILLFDFGSYIQPDLVCFLEKAGCRCHNVYYNFADQDYYHNEAFESVMEKELREGSFDLVMSTNFFPVIGKVAHTHHLKYISWHYDSPMNLERTEGFDYPTNYIFLFDRSEFLRYKKTGLDTVYHLPLAVNCERLSHISEDASLKCDVSLLGRLYQSTLPVFLSQMKDYDKGYMDAILRVQSELYGTWLVNDMLTPERMASVNTHYQSLSEKAIQISDRQLSYSIATHLTHRDRMLLLRLLSENADTLLCSDPLSDEEKRLLPRLRTHRKLSYLEEMPRLFKSSKINLNVTLRCTESGIPLRALDIMGCGGFLLSNYQPELAEYLVPEEEVVLYESIEDAVGKAMFYLSHPDLREQIAKAGLQRMLQDFRYEDRIKTMFETADLN